MLALAVNNGLRQIVRLDELWLLRRVLSNEVAAIQRAVQVAKHASGRAKRSKAEDKENAFAEARRLVFVFCVFLAAHLVLDLAVVSYYERQDAVFFVLLFAAARLLRLQQDGALNRSAKFSVSCDFLPSRKETNENR